MKRLPEQSAAAAKRVGDVVGISAALIGTIVLHFFMFGGDQFFPLRFLLTPAGDPIAFAAFAGSLVVLIVKVVKTSRADQWGVLFGAFPDWAPGAGDHPMDKHLALDGQPVARAQGSVLGALTRRALKAAAIVAAGATLFVAIFIISVIPVFVIVFGVAALLIAASYIVMRVIAERERGADPAS